MVDDLLVALKDLVKTIQDIEDTYQLKGNGIPGYYLGGNVSSGEINWAKHIATSAKTYIKRLVKKIERMMGWDLRKHNSLEDPNYHRKLNQ